MANNPANLTDPSGEFFWFILGAMALGSILQGAFTHDWSIGNLALGALKGLALGSAVWGVGALIGGAAGLASGGLAGGLGGLMAPGTGAMLAAGALAAPAAWGMFDPNAPDWAKGYATGYLIAGAVGNAARAVTMAGIHSLWSDSLAEGANYPGKYGAAVRMFDGAWRWMTATSAMASAVSLLPLGLRGAEESCRERAISGGVPCY